jgi:protein phosphatase
MPGSWRTCDLAEATHAADHHAGTEPANLARLRDRNLGRKRSLALREYALGLEALDRVARGDPLWRIHEAVSGVLALESEPVDPRL